MEMFSYCVSYIMCGLLIPPHSSIKQYFPPLVTSIERGQLYKDTKTGETKLYEYKHVNQVKPTRVISPRRGSAN